MAQDMNGPTLAWLGVFVFPIQSWIIQTTSPLERPEISTLLEQWRS